MSDHSNPTYSADEPAGQVSVELTSSVPAGNDLDAVPDLFATVPSGSPIASTAAARREPREETVTPLQPSRGGQLNDVHTELVVAMLEMAVWNRQPRVSLVHYVHSHQRAAPHTYECTPQRGNYGGRLGQQVPMPHGFAAGLQLQASAADPRGFAFRGVRLLDAPPRDSPWLSFITGSK